MKTDKQIFASGKWRKVHINGGYYCFNLNGKMQLLHRYLYQKYYRCSILPGIHVHHKDGDKLNNDMSNLELLTHAQHNREHRFKGGSAYYRKDRNMWQAQVKENKKQKNLGLFLTEQEAREALAIYYGGDK